MTLSQGLSKLLSSSSSPKILSAIRSLSTKTVTQSLPTEGTSNKRPTSFNCLKPTTIPYQSKVANSVHFVGSIEYPVQLSSLPDGVLCAFTVLLQENKMKNLAHLRIPVVFHGDLAQTAILHLKEKDLVYITGQLSVEALLHATDDKIGHFKDFRNNLQVLAGTVQFVQKMCTKTHGKIAVDQDEEELDSSAKIDEKPLDHQLWNDLFAHPDDWWDNRSSKGNFKRSSFKHKKSGQSLWINDSTPEWVLSKLDELPSAKTPSIGACKSNKSDSLWADLIDNPDQWFDYRENKLNKLVKQNPKYPDFKQKSTGTALWLNSAPDWAVSKLQNITESRTTGNDFKDISVASIDPKGIKEAEIDEKPLDHQLWNDLFAHPDDWRDNRSSKGNFKRSSFKHKKNGQSLWINDSTPEWVLSKLDELPSAKTASIGACKSNKNDSLWADLIDNPDQWFDYRENKLNKWVKQNPKYPDFKHKSTGTGLWLNSAPDWAVSKLQNITESRTTGNDFKDISVASIDPKGIKEEDLWKNLVENPNKWWDNRSSKRKPTYPDFKHKDTSQALWIGKKTPQWVLDKLPPATTNTRETKE